MADFSPLEIAQRHFGDEGMKRSPSRREVYGALDAIAEAVLGQKARIEAMEAHGVKYAGTFQRAQSYRKGTVVTADGAMWVALRDTEEGEQPGKALEAWQLAEKIRKRVKARRKPA